MSNLYVVINIINELLFIEQVVIVIGIISFVTGIPQYVTMTSLL